MSSGFKALLLDDTDGVVTPSITTLDESQLPESGVTVAVEYSSLNYKDGMIIKGLGKLVRQYPHVPGIDLAGTVTASDDSRFSSGDKVMATGWRIGELHWGGFAHRAKVDADHLLKLPTGMDARQAMAVGTAGFTAMAALMAVEGSNPNPGEQWPLLVTGASGGVGSSAVMWASARGHHVVAATGRSENADILTRLGAAEVIDRAELADNPTRPMLSERWGGCIDSVGGDTLAHVLAEMSYGGQIAACGLAGGNSLNTTVIPFLLRGVNLLGIDSVMCPSEQRAEIWEQISQILNRAEMADKLEAVTNQATLEQLPELADQILAGKVRGRTVIACEA